MGSIPAGDVYIAKSEISGLKSEQNQNKKLARCAFLNDEAGNVIEMHEHAGEFKEAL